MMVPVIPVVAALVLHIMELESCLGQQLPVELRTGQKLVLESTGQIHTGLLTLEILDQPPGIHIGVHDLLPLLLGPAQHPQKGTGAVLEHPQRRRQGDDLTEGIVVLEAVSHGAVAAHAQPADEGVLPLVREGEHPPGDLHQLLTDPLAVIRVEAGAVHIEAVLTGGHDHRQIPLLGPPLDPGAADPVHMTAPEAVQQIQCLILFQGHILPRRGQLVRRQDHLHLHTAQKHIGNIGKLDQSHGNTSSLICPHYIPSADGLQPQKAHRFHGGLSLNLPL